MFKKDKKVKLIFTFEGDGEKGYNIYTEVKGSVKNGHIYALQAMINEKVQEAKNAKNRRR